MIGGILFYLVDKCEFRVNSVDYTNVNAFPVLPARPARPIR